MGKKAKPIRLSFLKKRQEGKEIVFSKTVEKKLIELRFSRSNHEKAQQMLDDVKFGLGRYNLILSSDGLISIGNRRASIKELLKYGKRFEDSATELDFLSISDLQKNGLETADFSSFKKELHKFNVLCTKTYEELKKTPAQKGRPKQQATLHTIGFLVAVFSNYNVKNLVKLKAKAIEFAQCATRAVGMEIPSREALEQYVYFDRKCGIFYARHKLYK